MADFDLAAEQYDQQFSHTCVGKEQRAQVWKRIEALNIPSDKRILEINCGTGEDAHRWSKRNVSVHATDISSAMIQLAKKKFPDLSFETMDLRNLQEHPHTYDVLFSNFGGLNCLSPEELNDFFSKAHDRLLPDGRLILIIMGTKCAWDRLFLILKGRFNERKRRQRKDGTDVNVDGKNVRTYYYSPAHIRAMASGYAVESVRPIGLFVPPSYLAATFERRPRSFRFLVFLDKCVSFPWLSNRADHFFISLTKKPS